MFYLFGGAKRRIQFWSPESRAKGLKTEIFIVSIVTEMNVFPGVLTALVYFLFAKDSKLRICGNEGPSLIRSLDFFLHLNALKGKWKES